MFNLAPESKQLLSACFKIKITVDAMLYILSGCRA